MSSTIFTPLGASSHTSEERAATMLLDLESFNENIWEPAAGEGHLSKVISKRGYKVKSTDLIDRGFGEGNVNFLSDSITKWDGDIITNPPYKYSSSFVKKSLSIIPVGNKVAMFLKITFLEGKKRKGLFLSNPPKTVYVSSSRILCAKNGEFERMKAGGGSAAAYGWFVWEKGFRGDPVIKWFN